MEFSKKKIVRLSLNLTLLGALFPCVLFSADLRQRNGNVIVSRTTDLTQSSNKTDVINIKTQIKMEYHTINLMNSVSKME